MQTLILYASKYGAAREIAERIAQKMGDAKTCDLNQDDIPGLNLFDCVIIGSSLRAGFVRKEAKVFLSHNADKLRGKKLGLFLCGMDTDKNNEEKYFNTNFPPELLPAAKAKSHLGGIFDPQKAGAMECFIMKKILKQSGYVDRISDDRISQFVEAMKA